MTARHIRAGILAASGLVTLIGAALVGIKTPQMQRTLVNDTINAPHPTRVIYPNVYGGDSTSARNTSAASKPSRATVSAQSQPSAPGAQAVVAARNMPTGLSTPTAPASGAPPPSPERVAQAAPAETVERAAVAEAPGPQLLDINTASSDELDRLAGRIGKAIVRGRPYQSIDDLVSKRVLNRGTFGQIKDRITVR
jgi:DNA uptake protein ComE-like DNA-binding protein